MTPSEPAISVVPANEASWEDLQTVFGTRGAASRCQCQRYKLRPREAFGKFPAEERAYRLREQTDCGHPGVGHDQRARRLPRRRARRLVRGRAAHRLRGPGAQLPRPVGGPRGGQDRRQRLGGDLPRSPAPGFRKRGVSRALARAAVDFARERGARALEGYPITTKNVIAEELHVGTEAVVRRGRLHRGQPADPAPRRDAGRLLTRAPRDCGVRHDVKRAKRRCSARRLGRRPLGPRWDGHGPLRRCRGLDRVARAPRAGALAAWPVRVRDAVERQHRRARRDARQSARRRASGGLPERPRGVALCHRRPARAAARGRSRPARAHGNAHRRAGRPRGRPPRTDRRQGGADRRPRARGRDLRLGVVRELAEADEDLGEELWFDDAARSSCAACADATSSWRHGGIRSPAAPCGW